MGIDIRSISSDEIESFYAALAPPFGFDPTPESLQAFRDTFETRRLQAAFDGPQIVATFGAFSLQLTVPGGVVPTAGTTVVTVLPTHRRRGIMRQMMTQHLAEVHERQEPLAALWASESSIYGRFGYGAASERSQMKLPKPYARLRSAVDVTGVTRLVDVDKALQTFPTIYRQVAEQRPGMCRREDAWWRHRTLLDLEHSRGGASQHRRVLLTRGDQPVGYLLYRTKIHGEGRVEARVIELLGVDADAEMTLWQFTFGIDLVDFITYENQPVDDPLRWWLEQPRRMERKVEDALWIRPVDVAAALAGRRYAAAGSLTFRFRDQLCPWNEGLYRLDVSADGSARCEPTTTAPQLELTAESLGAVYLGGNRIHDLARAGVLRGEDDALRVADRLFSWDRLPWCQEVF